MGVDIAIYGRRLTDDQIDATYTGYDSKSIAQLLMTIFVADNPSEFRPLIDRLDIGDLEILNYDPDDEWSFDKEPDSWRPPLAVAAAIRRLDSALRDKTPESVQLAEARMKAYNSENSAEEEIEWLLMSLPQFATHCETLAAMGEDQVTFAVSD